MPADGVAAKNSLWAELRRRRVVRLAIVYVIVAWIVIQAAATIFPGLNIPDWGFSLVVAIAILGFPIALVVAWGFDLRVVRTPALEPQPAAQAAAPVPAAPSAPAAPDKSIAVLPFLNMSDERENEYFSDGITEEILNALVKVKGLHVASRSSSFAFKGKEIDIHDVGEKLSVATVMEGSVRKAGDRIRITAQLIDVATGFHLWSETYDRKLEDVFAVQDEIAHAIVAALKPQLGGEAEVAPLVVRSTENLDAYTHYLKGRFYFNKSTEADTHKSLELYEAALRHDPNYARAYAGIADSWMQLADDWMAPAIAYPKAKEAARKAIALDATLAEAHTALGKVLCWYDWSFDAAELSLRRAVAANPQYGDAHWGLASVLPSTGRMDEAVAEMENALALDPLSATFSRWLARFLLYARRYDDAIAQARKTLELDPAYSYAYVEIGHVHLVQGRPEEALKAYAEGERGESIAFFRAFTARALTTLGRTEEARRVLAELESGEQYVRFEVLASAYGLLGDYDRAFILLDRAIDARSAGLIYLAVDPIYDSLKRDARFDAACRRIGLVSA